MSGENGLHAGGAEPCVESIEQRIAGGAVEQFYSRANWPFPFSMPDAMFLYSFRLSPCRWQHCHAGHVYPYRNCAELSLELRHPVWHLHPAVPREPESVEELNQSISHVCRTAYLCSWK